ncbi:hypothetical protein H4V96_003760 [Janthinobacterium sp. CG_23.4]|jgi:hypothetical protein|nr:hypothetical protein [Janthinobacterium sp. CG_23.4]
MPTSLHVKVWSLLVYVIVATSVAVWLHPSVLLLATCAFA